MKDQCLRIPARVCPFTRFYQCGLPICKLRAAHVRGARVARHTVWHEDFHQHVVILERPHRKMQGMNRTLQSCLQVNTNQIIQSRLNVHLNKRANVAFHQLFTKAVVIAPHGTTLRQDWSTCMGKETDTMVGIDPFWESKCGNPTFFSP